jgi:hypothetical protein
MAREGKMINLINNRKAICWVMEMLSLALYFLEAYHGRDPIANSSSERSSFPFVFVSRYFPAQRMMRSLEGQFGSSSRTSRFAHSPSSDEQDSAATADEKTALSATNKRK